MASSMLDEDQVPVDVVVDSEMIRIRFNGGLELATPVARFPRLLSADPSKRMKWELIGRGTGIHWPDVDEDISIRGLFATSRKLPDTAIEQVPVLISDLLKTAGRLNILFQGRPFTPDGHLVGSIGEVVAEYIYDLKLMPCSTPQIDAFTKEPNARSVQVKLTGEKGKSFGVRSFVESNTTPDILICMRMTSTGFTEVYNGPFPMDLIGTKVASSNGQISVQAYKLQDRNPSLLPTVRSFVSINRWFKSTPELAEVA